MRISLRFKLFAMVSISLIIMFVSISFYIIVTMSEHELETRETFVQTLTEISSANFGHLIQDENHGELLAQMKGVSLSFNISNSSGEKKSDIAFIAIYKAGVLLEAINKNDLAKYLNLFSTQPRKIELKRANDIILVSNPIYYSGKVIGAIVLGYSLNSYFEGINKHVRFIALIVFIFLVIALILALLFINSIVKHINNLKNYVLKISQGDLSLETVNIKTKDEINILARAFEDMVRSLKGIITKVRDITVNLNSCSKEIEAAAQEQTTAANEHASGITEVSATLEELSITAKQITANAGELIVASEEAIKLLKNGEGQLAQTVKLLEEVGQISKDNSLKIGELGKRSEVINEMVEIIKDVSNKTNMLSINASIEASRAGEAGKGFSVVAAEIRELSKETIASAKKVGEAGREIQNMLNDIIVAAESEANKVISCGLTIKEISTDLERIVEMINDNYNFTQKIDVSIKQQEIGSTQAAETMKQMAEISQQSAETARQTLLAVKDIVNYATELNTTVEQFHF